MSIPTHTAHGIERRLQEIAEFFKPGAKITLLVRNPGVPGDADLVMTIDELPLAIAALQRRQAILEAST